MQTFFKKLAVAAIAFVILFVILMLLPPRQTSYSPCTTQADCLPDQECRPMWSPHGEGLYCQEAID